MGSWPEKVGIIGIELVIPAQYVDQKELEEYDGVGSGKYVIGLGQSKMAFCTDREDVNSLCLTAVQRLIENYGINYKDVGRLEVGTETLLDKSKSIKTVLMQLFEPYDVYDVEGIDTINACYGGTSALFNAISWVESSSWDGRYAIVVCADITYYARGPARPTGGAGAIAMLVGANAPLVVDRGVRASYMKHVYDFYKPDLTTEYAVVDGKLTIQCYLEALDNCYQLYRKKVSNHSNAVVTVNNFNYIVFHTPFCKLIQKSVARLVLNDFLNAPHDRQSDLYPGLDNFKNTKLTDNYFDKDLENAFVSFSKNVFDKKTSPSLLVANQIGNMYTPSLYGGLVSLLVNESIEKLAGNKVCMFSYGSGLAATMYSITISKDCNDNSALNKLITNLSYVKKQLDLRKKVSPEKFTTILETTERNCHKAPYEPISNIDDLFYGTYYLVKVDDKHRRYYNRYTSTTNGSVINDAI